MCYLTSLEGTDTVDIKRLCFVPNETQHRLQSAVGKLKSMELAGSYVIGFPDGSVGCCCSSVWIGEGREGITGGLCSPVV